MVTSFLLYIKIVCLLINYLLNGYADTDVILRDFMGASLKDCRRHCDARESCVGVVYFRAITYCRLYSRWSSVDTNGTSFNGQKAAADYIQMEEWHERLSAPCGSNVTCPLMHECVVRDTKPSCVISECGPAIHDINIQVLGNQHHIGAKVVYKCIDRFVSNNGTSTGECLPTGQWSPSFISCKPEFKITLNDTFMQPSWELPLLEMQFDPIYNVSLVECLLQCFHNYCLSVNYNEELKTCIPTDNTINKYGNGNINFNVSLGWNVMVKTLPVYFSQGSSAQRYTMSFNEARDFCVSQNTTIATLADLEEAYGLGYNLCQCGWIAENVAVIVGHKPLLDCHHKSTEGVQAICFWLSTWNVYCRNPDYFS